MSTSEETPPPTMAGPANPGKVIDEKQLMAAMEKVNSDEALRKAFNVLSSSMGTSKDHVSEDVIPLAMPILGVQAIKIDDNFFKKAQVENAQKIDCDAFIRIMKNIWKGMADSMINEVEKVIDDLISNKANLENIRREFSNSIKDTWERVADSIIRELEKGIDDEFISGNAGQEIDGIRMKDTWERVSDSIIREVEKRIDEFISGNAGQENDGIRMKDIWKRVTNLKIHEVKKENDESIPNKVVLPQWFINILKYLWERVVDSTISEVEKEIDEFISNKAELENGGNIRDEFISCLKNIQKIVDDSMIKEEVGSEEVLRLAADAMVLDGSLGSDVSVALLRRLIPYLGCNLKEAEIIDVIKDVKDNVDDGKINREEFIKIVRNIWKKSAEFLSKAMGGRDADMKEAFKVLLSPLDDFASATILNVVMLNLGGNLDFEELYRTIDYVKADPIDEKINSERFVDIIDYVKYLIKEYPLDKIYGVLTSKKTRKVVLSGESGVGKTWMATRIADRVTKEGIFDCALWVNLKGLDLLRIIAYQLSLLSASDEMEVKEMLGGDKKNPEILEERIHEALQNKMVLLIFDGVNNREELDKALSKESKLHGLVNLNEPKHKFLITTSDSYKLTKKELKGEWIGIEVKRWTSDESTSFLRSMITAGKYSEKEVQELAEFYIKQSKGLPAENLIIAKTLNYFVNSDEGWQKLQGVKEVVLKDAAHDYYDYRNIENLFISIKVVPKIVLVDCYSSETPTEHFLNKRGGVHYNELISYWILEGHLGHFSCIEDAYAEGHRVLMELLDCGLLKTLKAGYVKSNGKKFEFSSQDYFELYQNNRLGLATTFDNKLGNTVLGDGMIRTFPIDEEKMKKKEEEEEKKKKKKKEEEKMSTLLLDGDRTGEVSDNLFDSMEDLEVLAIFNPTQKPFPLRKLGKHLRFLVIRGCEFLTSFDKVFESVIPKPPEKPRNEARTLQKSMSLPATLPKRNSSDLISIPLALPQLIVLEISGPSSLKTIPENLFHTMENLKSLNMSSLQMDFLPPSFYNLSNIEILILKDCSSLKRMESLKNFEKLQLLDLSGATSLEAFKDKSFSKNEELRTINLSQSRIAKFPVVRSLKKLQYLSLSNCPALIRVRKIGSVKTLRIFDISGSKNVEQLLDPGLQELENLFTLNVSGTALRRLPSTIGKPRNLHLSDCSNLKQLPPIEILSEVRVLDLSGSALLDDVKPGFITSLKNLVTFNLSKTGIVRLPSLSSLVNLRSLLVSQCQRLEELEGLGSLTNLEVLDLSGCKALSKIEDQSFDKMDRLDCLDLSETPLQKLPSLSKLEKLRKLNLRGCTNLTKTPGLEDLPVLEELDISRTTLEVPNLKNPNCRRHGPKPSSYKEFNPKKILEDLGFPQLEKASGETEADQQASEETEADCDDKTKLTQEKTDQYDHWSIFNRLASHDSKTNDEHVIDAHFLKLLEKYPKLLKESSQKFHFIVYPMEEAAHQSIRDRDLLRNEFNLKKILFRNVVSEVQERCLEIRGFRDFPKFLEQLLECAEILVLIDDSCIRFLSDLDAGNLKMKACWIERCSEMEYVTDEAVDILTKNIEFLWVSEAAKLKSITSCGIGFSGLMSLYLEYCPELSSLCFSYKQLVVLKILHVKYCQKLVKLFDDEQAQLPKLESLHLWALPALKEISCGMESLGTLTVAHCPLLEYIFDSEASFPTKNATSLQLQLKFCENMKTILRDGQLPSAIPPGNIITLGCPNLQIPGSSALRNP